MTCGTLHLSAGRYVDGTHAGGAGWI